MGSFANCLHIKCEDAEKVVSLMEEAMRDGGYEATDEEPDEEMVWQVSSPMRAMYVSESHNGWVGLLDFDLVNLESLAADLSRRLDTSAILFMVHDSDSWLYQLFRHGSLLDEFDSTGGEHEEFETDEMTPEIVQMLSDDGLATMKQDLQRRMAEIQQRTADAMPAHIRDIQQRMPQGTATQEELKQYGEWAKAQSQQMAGDINELLSETTRPPIEEQPLSQDELNAHAEKLRPILPSDATDGRVVEVLGKQALYAEEVLGDFLQLLGVQPFFANLSYRYLDECTTDDLREADISMVAHLKFKTNASGA